MTPTDRTHRAGIDGNGGPSPAAAPRSALAVIFLTVFIDLLGFGIVLPVMPRQAEPYLAAMELPTALRGVTIGLLFSSFSLMQFLFSPVWGRVSDRIGRRPILILSLAGSVVFYALYGLAVTFPTEQAAAAIAVMFLSRIGAGIAGASVGTAAAVIADCTPPENRARGMALIGIAFGAGFTLGPLIAYFGLAIFDRRPWGVGVLASMLSLVALGIAVAVFRETRDPANKAGREFFSLGRTASVLAMPAIGTCVLVYFLSIFSFANFEATLALFTRHAFGMTDDDNFLVFALIGVVLVIAGGGYRAVAKRWSEASLLRAGLVLMVIGLGGVGLVAWRIHAGGAPESGVAEGLSSAALPWFYAAAAAAVVGFACVNPSISAIISQAADPARQGEVLGVNQSFASLGRILGPFVGSVLFTAHASHALPYAVAVATLLIALSLAGKAMRSARAWTSVLVVLVGCIPNSVARAADEFNMGVTTAGIQLGPHVSGPVLTPESLAHRVVLLEFWGVRCPPCIASMPKLEEAHKQLAPMGLVVIGAHVQGGPADEVRKAAADLGATFTVVDGGSVAGGQDFQGIPHCMLFDHTGKCVYRGSPFKARDAIVAAVEAAPSSILAGRRLEKLASFNEGLRNEATFGAALRKAASLTSSKDADTAEEAKFVVEKLEAHGRRMLENGLAMKESNPSGAVDLVQRCGVAFKGSDVGDEAAATLREWRKDKSFQTAVKAAQQLAKLQLLRAEVLKSFGDDASGQITAEMVAAIPPAMKRKMAEVIAGIQKTAPGSETVKTAAALAEEFRLEVVKAP